MLLNNISSSSPLGKSDHVIVEANLNVESQKAKHIKLSTIMKKGLPQNDKIHNNRICQED